MNSGLHWIDLLIIAAYACGMLALGWYYSRKQSSADEYFTGGRKMNPLFIGISLFATLLSTISYLAKPGEIIKNGPGNLLAVSKRATDLVVTPLFTLFFMALFVRFATPIGANAGSLCGFVAAALIAFWNPLFEQERSISFTWINPIALFIGISVGCVVSLVTSQHDTSSKELA